ncbi:MAG: sulfite exporter TauE/SafE family protein [Planctomycetota bacterium]
MEPVHLLGYAGVAIAVALIGVTKSGFGAGMGLLVVPMTAIALGFTPAGSESALGLLLPLLIVGDIIAIAQHHKHFAWDLLKRLLPGTAVGVVVGGAVLFLIKQQAGLVEALIRIEIGIECVVLVSLHWWRQWKGTQEKLMPEPARGLVTGMFIAISSTLAHAAGPIFAMYVLPLKKTRDAFVGTSALYFFMLNNAKIPAYIMAGQFADVNWIGGAALAPLVLVGALFGFALKKRMTDALFMKLVYVVTFMLGWGLLIDGVAKLLS